MGHLTGSSARGGRVSFLRKTLVWSVLLLFGITATACGGAQGGAGPNGAGQGLILLAFVQDSFDNVSYNTILEFIFSEPVNPDTVSTDSIQIREGPNFGKSVPGTFRFEGAKVFWEPQLPGLCDLSDGALKADTQYRIQTIGFPEEFAIRNTAGQPLNETSTYEFHTRLETDPGRFIDQIPARLPAVIATTPSDGNEAVDVLDGNVIELTMSENLDPCTINDTNILLNIYEFGDKAVFADAPNGLDSGFAVGADTSDQAPLDPFTWGANNTTPVSPPQKILADIHLIQDFASTRIVIAPTAGRFPENSLVVLQLTTSIQDFGGDSLAGFTMAFTTENLPLQKTAYVLEAAGETVFDPGQTTADINTGRAPSRVQGFLLFAGDGDNGQDPLLPTLPQDDAGTCANDRQLNDAMADDFDPVNDVLLDTGATANPCENATDGSFGVIWEFKTFRIRNGVTAYVIGINPAIFLVQGDVLIENGGRLMARGTGQGGSPRGAGEGNKNATTNNGTAGGIGVAGGGNGGASPAGTAAARRVGGDGEIGYFHTTPQGALDASVGTSGSGGSGRGNTSALWQQQANPNNRNTPSGGGGGHATAGDDGVALGSGSSPTSIDTPLEGEGGSTYGDNSGRMLTPEAGSGGGAGGELRSFRNIGQGPGGAGGAGGGFIDLTSGGNIDILGTIDAAGSPGGSNPGGNFSPNYAWNPGTGGGGGGSGGGIRLLTPNDISFAATTTVSTAGGQGGPGGASQGTNPPSNNGGNGGVGRLAMEDGNSVISNLSAANVIPGEGGDGFYRNVFDATRFQGGGLTPQAVTEIFAAGPLNPDYVTPTQTYGVQEDFITEIISAASRGAGMTGILIEAQGFQTLPDATPDLTTATGWFTVGHFTDSGIENMPTWNVAQPTAAQLPGGLPVGNVGLGIANLNTCEFLQIRITFYLDQAIGATDPGHFIDRWTICFTSDQ